FDKEFSAILSLYHNGSSIMLQGPVSGPQKLQELCNADCLILPSWNEGQPLVILEAMALGVPVIATDVGFVRETLGERYPYLIPPKDENALFESILQFIEDKKKVAIGEQLKRRYDKKFSRGQHRRKILRAFADVCST
ncbi:MAG: glycosyltransferase family 4 protein, partial [Saprospiraceae bacterium]|nr:glycosyltransferase family 4 protein [Saprospiraceae bacterium]